MDEELQWIRSAMTGDHVAFGELVRRYQGPVYNLCLRMLGNATEAEDAAQETFLRAFSRLKSYDEGYRFSSWILSIGSHYCIDCLRRRRPGWLSLDELVSLPPSDRREGQPEEALLRSESEKDVQRLLEQLTPVYRNIVVLRYWHQLSYAEISEVLGISEAAVKSRLHRARKAMAGMVAGQGQVTGSLDRVSCI